MPDTSLNVTLGPRLVREIFPYLLVLDRELCVTQYGHGIRKVFREIQPGAKLTDLCAVFRPRGAPSFDAFLLHKRSTFFFDAHGTGVRLRGQVVHDEERDQLIFIGSPWFTDAAQLENAGFSLSDFTVHDPIVDFLYMAQAQVLALDDVKRSHATIVRQRDELEAKNQELLRASAAKSQFLANTSHELRTPLGGIIGMATLLLRLELSPLAQNYAEKLLRSAKSLLTVVNDILDFSKIEAGKLAFERSSFDLPRLVHDLADIAAVSAQLKGIEVVCVVEADVPLMVSGDPSRLRQVVDNLLGNAIKFTDAGEVVLRVDVVEASERDLLVRFRVTDTGVGIAVDRRDALFKPFEQVDGSMTRRHGGTGLGLAISKQLVEGMGGTIGFESEPDRGSTFWFTARLAREGGEAGEDASWAGLGGSPLAGRRALVVDDSTTSRSLVHGLLTRWGARGDMAESAVSALERIRAAAAAGAPYDAVIVDAHMPVMTGADLLLVVAASPAFESLKTVVLTTADQSPDVDVAMKRVRVDAFVTKPVRASLLYNALVGLWGQGAKQLAPVAPAPAAAPATGRRVLVVDDNPVNQEVAAHMVASLGHHVDIAENGREALDALARTPYDVVLMDMQMPVLDGYQATAEIRRREVGAKRTVIVALTAHAMESDRVNALAAGMDDYLAKPINFDALRAVLAKYIKGDEAGPRSTRGRDAAPMSVRGRDLAPMSTRGRDLAPMSTRGRDLPPVSARSPDPASANARGRDPASANTRSRDPISVNTRAQEAGPVSLRGRDLAPMNTRSSTTSTASTTPTASRTTTVTSMNEPAPVSTRAPVSSRAPTVAANPIDWSVLEKLRPYQKPGGSDLIGDVIRKFLADLDTNGAAVADALARGDLPAAGASAHRLKSSAGLVGAAVFSKLCADLETACAGHDAGRATALGRPFEAERSRVRAALAAALPAGPRTPEPR